ncbi:MAG TPA: hypothetical protein VIV15_07165 [Anaerolineales bacterium]
MRLRTLLLVGTVLAFLFALALLLGPAIILKFFGLTANATEVLLAQVIGAGLIGVGLLCWFAKDFGEAQALQGTVLALFVASAVAFVVSLLGVLAKVPRGASAANAWIPVILFLLFAAGLAYFQFFGPRE